MREDDGLVGDSRVACRESAPSLLCGHPADLHPADRDAGRYVFGRACEAEPDTDGEDGERTECAYGDETAEARRPRLRLATLLKVGPIPGSRHSGFSPHGTAQFTSATALHGLSRTTLHSSVYALSPLVDYAPWTSI